MNELQQRIRDLRTVERRVTPDAAWIRATRTTLLKQAANTLGDASLKQERIHVVMGSVIGTFFNRYMRRPIVAIVSLVVFAVGGSLMSVSAAERALPGDFLYGLKLATEQAQLALISTKEDKLKLKTNFTERRVQELKEVSGQKNDAKVKQVAEILKSDLNTLKEQLSDVKTTVAPDAVADVAKLVDQSTSAAIVTLQQSKTDLSPDAKQTVTEAQSAAADTGVQAIEVLVEQHQTSSSTIPVADVAEAIQNHTNAVANLMQPPLELPENATSSVSATSTSSVDALIQSIATSTASTVTNGTSTTPLPELVTQVKDMTAQVFAIQKASEQLEADASSTPLDATAATGTPSTATSTSMQTKSGSSTSTSSTSGGS